MGTLVNGGTLGSALRNGIIGGLFGAVSAGLTYGVAEVFGHGTGMLGSKALAHGLVSSFMTRARGGKWNSGFWAGFSGTLLSPVTNMARGYYAKVAANAMVAGTVSVISGGKFANGAFSGAFRFMFNDAMHTYLTNKDMNIRTGYAAGEEKNRIFSLSSDDFKNEMDFNGSVSDVYIAKMKLNQELNKYIIVSGARGIQDSVDLATPTRGDSIFDAIEKVFDFLGPKTSYGFDYDCHTSSNCHVKGMYVITK